MKNIGSKEIFRKWGLLIGLVFLIIVFSLASNRFLSLKNVANIMRQATIIGIMALGVTFALMVGDFDLSFATLASLLNVINITLIINGWPIYIVFILTIVMGILFGLFNSFLIVKVGIHAFIATLATMTLAKGLVYWITKGSTVYGKCPEALTFIGRTNVFNNSFPICIFVFIILAIVCFLVAEKTKIGRYLYAVGGNSEAAKFSGINVNFYRVLGITASSFCTALATIIMTSSLAAATPESGDGYQMAVIPVVFLGTVFLRPGSVNIAGTFVATLMMAVIENGLVMLNVPFYFKYIVQALAIIIAIGSITNAGSKKIGGPKMV